MRFPRSVSSSTILMTRLLVKIIMASDDDVKSNSEENFDWNVENEIRLFEAMIGHKPVGINKHFHMACITEKFETLMGRPVSSDIIWKHLGTMFDLAALDKKETLPFPNDEEDFSLPESDYLDLINEKLLSKTEPFSDIKESTKEGRTTPKVKDATPAKETKKEKKVDVEESGSNNESDKREATESENEGKKVKSKEEKTVAKTRGKRSLKDKKSDEESVQASVPVSKKEEELPSTPNSSKKEKQVVGKRTLRSRVDELSSTNKSVTPPPGKRARRI